MIKSYFMITLVNSKNLREYKKVFSETGDASLK